MEGEKEGIASPHLLWSYDAAGLVSLVQTETSVSWIAMMKLL